MENKETTESAKKDKKTLSVKEFALKNKKGS